MMDIGDTFSLIHKNVIALNGKTNINNAIYQILHLEAKKTQGQIQILAQPEYTFLIDLLAAISKVNHSLEIQHILCLNNTDTVTSSLQNYNILCLKNMMPMCECPCQYTSHYYYNNIHSLIGTLNVLPHLVLTTDYAVTFSSDLKYGVFYQDKETILMFHNLFSDYMAQTSPLIRKTELALEQCEQFSSMNLGETPGFSFQSEPCLIPLIPAPFLEKYVRHDIPNRELTIQRIAAYIKMQYDRMHSGKTKFIFSKQGVINFMTTGILSEIPPNLFLAFDLSDRIILINRLLDTCLNKNHYLLSGDIEMLDNSLCIYTSTQNGYLLFQNSFGELTNLIFEEPSILHAFYDFMENLDAGNMLASQDELLCFLKSVISNSRLKCKP